MKTGNTTSMVESSSRSSVPQWSPVMKTGNTCFAGPAFCPIASPQWSPVMKTGNTYPVRRIATSM